MRYFFGNKRIKTIAFSSNEEMLFYTSQHTIKHIVTLEDSFGDVSYMHILYEALTAEKKIAICFSSDEAESRLNLLFWPNNHIFVMDTGRKIYTLSEDFQLNRQFNLDINSPLIGLYITKSNNLLVLEEASLRIVDSSGKILRSELFDLVENFTLENEQLSIQTSEGNAVFDLK
jgi:hypothetical protein